MYPFVIPPKHDAALPGPQPVSPWILVVSVALVLMSGLIYLRIGLAGPGFAELFGGLGDRLPLVTRVALLLDGYAGVLTLVSFLPCVALFRHRRAFPGDINRCFTWVIGGFGLALTVLFIWITAMYLPLESLGDPVS